MAGLPTSWLIEREMTRLKKECPLEGKTAGNETGRGRGGGTTHNEDTGSWTASQGVAGKDWPVQGSKAAHVPPRFVWPHLERVHTCL